MDLFRCGDFDMKITHAIKCSTTKESRTKLLSRICPEFRQVMSEYKYQELQRDNPDLAEACYVFIYSHGNVNTLDEQLELLDEGYSDISNTLVELIKLFSESGEIELAMFATRWAHDNGYTKGQQSFRL